VPRLVGGRAFVAAAGFFLGRSSPELRPQMKTAKETTQAETTTMQSPKSHDDPSAADAAAPEPAAAPPDAARILAIGSRDQDEQST
jgi:hypothetical protein